MWLNQTARYGLLFYIVNIFQVLLQNDLPFFPYHPPQLSPASFKTSEVSCIPRNAPSQNSPRKTSISGLPSLDLSNLGKTLIPVIGVPHWKPKYNGAVHRIVRGKDPALHHNPVDELLKDFVKPAPKRTAETDPECRDIKSTLLLSDVLRKYGMDISQNPTKCLWHGSRGGRCFSFDDSKGLWHCFHCDRSGNIFGFIMEQEQCDFITAKEKAADLAGIKLEL